MGAGASAYSFDHFRDWFEFSFGSQDSEYAATSQLGDSAASYAHAHSHAYSRSPSNANRQPAGHHLQRNTNSNATADAASHPAADTV